ncbi:putative acyl-CoA dehydrogenase-related protein [Pseudonocardia dioxanivorans CB1190]|uniref:Acyl-CoA dehydrogenase-related protein n=1 Tax=Pseudonocardia dioxanivorans (strain ATCC 55486 / DSM 44775 / JCM 13855 / CB1190) TaxID=675635 RepID=F4CVP2_PSEUX|nr:acyl-CoA dehydrogenase-like protein [Pseudonocardia dioxanivorans]AEA24602.1 putative acyl-CoA dehydrogenase-related protein [Pseudonocardia dioxanivorans CB1190]
MTVSLPGVRHRLLGSAPPDPGPAATGDAATDLARAAARGETDLPAPGAGATAQRWAALARWGRTELSFARLCEGHTDAVAILAEAGRTPVPGATYGVWAARSGGTGAVLAGGAGAWRLRGRVRFCSGAHGLDRALVVAAAPDGSRIADVPLARPGVRPVAGTWQTVGMARSDSADVDLDDVPVDDDALVGGPGWYTARPGFWHGGGGVAAVWLGGAAGVLDDLRLVVTATDPDPHRLALFGELHTGVAACDALLVATAAAIDDDPADAHREAVWTARAAVELACRRVLDVAPRLAGVAALTRGGRLAGRLADLGVYVRQHHGERDLAALGAAVLDPDGAR